MEGGQNRRAGRAWHHLASRRRSNVPNRAVGDTARAPRPPQQLRDATVCFTADDGLGPSRESAEPRRRLTAVSTCGGRVGRSDGRREWNSSTEAVSSPREAHLPPPRSFPTKPAASTDHYCILPRAPTRCPERATAPKARPRWRLRAGASSRPACAHAAAPVWLGAGGVAAGWRAVHLGGAPVSCSCSGRARRVGDRRIVPRGRALPRPDESALMSADEH